jgi:hypothetical protein
VNFISIQFLRTYEGIRPGRYTLNFLIYILIYLQIRPQEMRNCLNLRRWGWVNFRLIRPLVVGGGGGGLVTRGLPTPS